MILTIKKIYTKIKNLKLRCDNYKGLLIFIKSIKRVQTSKKILIPAGFNVSREMMNHDIILAGLLREKGAEIHYSYGRSYFKTSYSIFGGDWFIKNFKKSKAYYKNKDIVASKYFNKIGTTHNISDYLNKKDVGTVLDKVSSLSMPEMLKFVYLGVDIGHDAMGTVRNLHMVDDIFLVNNYKQEMQECLFDCMLYTLFFDRILNKVRPDIILTHDNFYMPWSLLSKLASKRKIKVYNYYMGIYKDTWIYANKSPAMEFDIIEEMWNNAKDRELTYDQNKELDALLTKRQGGDVGLLSIKVSSDSQGLDEMFNQPTAVYYPNVFWDLTAIGK